MVFSRRTARTLSLVIHALWLGIASSTMPALAANQTISNAVDGFVRPAYRTFAERTHELGPALAPLCKAYGKDALGEARQAFLETMEAWSEVEVIRIGPITEDNRLERILHWPDRKGIGLKQVQAALSNEDPTATDAVRLAGKSVAMQGLGALEFVLFGTGSEDQAKWASGYRCNYGAAIAGNLAAIADAVSTSWNAPAGFAAAWENPGAENAAYRTDDEALTDLLDIFVQGAEMVRDVRVNGFLGSDAGSDKPRQAIFWRSNATADSLLANMAGLSKLFDASHLGDLATGDNSYIGGSIDFEFSNAANALADLKEKPIATVLSEPTLRGKLGYFNVVTSSLSELFGTRLAGALNLTAGFSSLDGD